MPNQVRTADLTYIWTDAGWLYLAIALDLFNREVVGWSIKQRMTADIAVDALTMAWFRHKPAPGLIQHSDPSGSAGNTWVVRPKECESRGVSEQKKAAHMGRPFTIAGSERSAIFGTQSGICSVLLSMRMRSPAGGLFENGGTFADVIDGAPVPRGVVRTTWLGGSAAPFFK